MKRYLQFLSFSIFLLFMYNGISAKANYDSVYKNISVSSGATKGVNGISIPITIRDFSVIAPNKHPDFGIPPSGATYGMVQPVLGADRKPVVKTSPFPGNLTSEAMFNKWFNDDPLNKKKSTFLDLTETTPGNFSFSDGSYYPINGELWGNEGEANNKNFTIEMHAEFVYDNVGTQQITITSDDDAWLFINGRLAIDLGGIHGAAAANVILNATAATTYGLTQGQTYRIDFFKAERSGPGSVLSFSTNFVLSPIYAPDANGIVYVKQNGAGSKDGSNWDNAADDLQVAINTLNVKEVWVAAGEYQPALNASFVMKDKVKIYGGFPTTGNPTLSNRNWKNNVTILKGNGNRVIYNNLNNLNTNALLDGFTITGGTLIADDQNIYGAGMYNNSSSPVISNCIFKNNVITRAATSSNTIFGKGGGMANTGGSSPQIINCVFINNEAYAAGGGIYNENSKPEIRACIFANNILSGTASHNGGGGMANAGSLYPAGLTSCVFVGNQAYVGAAIYNSSTSVVNQQIINCTFNKNNSTSSLKEPIYHNNSAFTFINTIVWDNTGTLSVAKQNGPEPVVQYSLLQGLNSTNDGNLDATNVNNAPQFVDDSNPSGADGVFGTADDGLMLKKTSPVVNRGDNTLYGTNLALHTDAAGNPRLYGGAIDMGAYESSYNPPIPDVNGIIYVKQGALGTALGNSWINAVPELADAMLAAKNLNTANAGTVKEIWVAKGTYKPKYSPQDGVNFGTDKGRDNTFLLVSNVKIYGGFPGTGNPDMTDRNWKVNPCILSGDIDNNDTFDANGNITSNKYTGNAYHVIVASAVSNTELNGFTIISGNASGGGYLTINGKFIYQNNGGGIYNYSSSLIFSNLTVVSNMATSGGGMHNTTSSNPILTNVIFSGNSAASGGGIYNSSSNPTLTNVMFSGNSGNPNGGAIYNTSSVPILTNVTLSGNTATNGGAIYNSGSNPQLGNSIIYGNSSGIYNSSSNPVISYSLVEGNASTTNNNIDATGITVSQIFTNPLTPAMGTKGDYTLKAGSPAIGMGSNALFAGLDAGTKDLAGNLRLNGSNIDLGAYEYQSTLPISLGNFTATVQNNSVKFQWNTLSENNNKEFILSRSADGQTYMELGRIGGAGTTQAPHNYTYYDSNPLNGINYYQLEQQDYDGKITLIGEKALKFGLVAVDLKAYPNPTYNTASVKFTSGLYQKSYLTDLTGRLLKTKEIKVGEDEIKYDLTGYPNGIYLIRLEGAKSQMLKVIKGG
ncbi:fibro-slime domain-containing protein [Pedobacter sp.]|uniref:fibro-slime domain-containing protein n=1 Tax=Pedobacter sp. TaxID=1411316 RepID=UPI00396C9C63